MTCFVVQKSYFSIVFLFKCEFDPPPLKQILATLLNNTSISPPDSFPAATNGLLSAYLQFNFEKPQPIRNVAILESANEATTMHHQSLFSQGKILKNALPKFSMTF